jgi:hypothetical protein
MDDLALAAPVLAGRESGPEQLGKALSAHPELGDFMRRGGLSLQRVYQMSTPMGDVVTVYFEGAGVEKGFELQATDESSFADLLRTGLAENHGVDVRQPPEAMPESLFDFFEPHSPRQPGIGFSAPVALGKIAVLREVCEASMGPRRAEFEALNRSLGVSVHRAYLSATPIGDVVSVYFEAPDPVEANRQFAADASPFGRYFRERSSEAFGIDFSQPLPPIRLVFEATA